MNIHPIVVHFPIALLMVYSALEVFRVGPVRRWQGVFLIKAFLVIVGSVSALIALQTGDLIEHDIARQSGLRQVIEVHSTFATSATVLFCLVAGMYLISWIGQGTVFPRLRRNHWFEIVRRCTDAGIHDGWVLLVTVPAAILLLVTGALGGIITLGPDTDPITRAVNNFFFP